MKFIELLLLIFALISIQRVYVKASFEDDLTDWRLAKYDPDEPNLWEIDSEEKNQSIKFPWTRWCGPGGAEVYDDLGKLVDVDKCCRAHDHCDNIESGQSKYGLRNNWYTTILHCQCDKEFRDCLRKIGTKWANTLGRLYFSYQTKCYRQEFPIITCKRKSKSYIQRNRCLAYEYNSRGSIGYQWFDLPFYYDPDDSDAFKRENIVILVEE